jgi:putative tricarboxylic transport membrane protein
MLDNFLTGTATLFGDPFTIGIFVFGVIGGMLFGAIPGVSMLTLAAILLPFTADLSPSQGVMLFAVIYCTGTYGGAITAILFNIPGAPENAPTAFDGYPMTQKGMAGKAVGAAVLCSAVGGVASAIVMMSATEPLAKWAIMNIGPPEIFALVFFWSCCCFVSWRAHNMERLVISPLWASNCNNRPGPRRWHQPL